MTNIKKEDWIKIAKQIYINVDEQTLINIDVDWNDLVHAFENLKKIDVSNLVPTDYCHQTSMNTLREDEPTKQTSDYFSKRKYSIE